MKEILLGCSLLFVSLNSIAAEDYCASWGCISTISELYTKADGKVYIGTPLDETIANCSPISDVYFTLDPSSPNSDWIYSSLIAAYMAGKKIQLRIKENQPDCEISYVRFDVSF